MNYSPAAEMGAMDALSNRLVRERAKLEHVRREVQMAKDILNTGQVESLAILRSLIGGLEVVLDE